MNILLADNISDDMRCLGASFIILGTITAAIYYLRANISEPTEKELLTLHKKRMELIREALASSAENDWNVPTQLRYPFESWVMLTPQGVAVAGKVLSPDTAFEVVARDERNISRAAVACDGRGTVLIESHGQYFRSRFEKGKWKVEQIQKPIT